MIAREGEIDLQFHFFPLLVSAFYCQHRRVLMTKCDMYEDINTLRCQRDLSFHTYKHGNCGRVGNDFAPLFNNADDRVTLGFLKNFHFQYFEGSTPICFVGQVPSLRSNPTIFSLSSIWKGIAIILFTNAILPRKGGSEWSFNSSLTIINFTPNLQHY